MAHDKQLVRLRRKRGIRVRISGSAERPRLTVFRSSKHIYAQVIDDVDGKTLATASTLSKDVKGEVSEANKTEAAKKVGALIAEICAKHKIERVVFDRNGALFHGKVKQFADAAREGGLKF